jgi:hypothetical protein
VEETLAPQCLQFETEEGIVLSWMVLGEGDEFLLLLLG